jgi:hypothetical protein
VYATIPLRRRPRVVGGGQATCIQTESKLQAIPISQASRTPRRRRRSLQELPAAGDRPAGKKAYPAPARAAVCPPRRPRCSTDATPASKILAAVAVPTSRPLMTPPARHPGCCRQRQVRLLATFDLDRLKDIRRLQIAPASDHAEVQTK